MTFVRFLHLLGIGAWLGAGAAAFLLVSGARTAGPRPRADRLALVGRLYSLVLAPAAILATASGIALTMMAASAGYGARLGAPASAAMQALGLLAGILEVFVAFPAAQRLGRFMAAADPAGTPPPGEKLRARLATLGPVILLLVIVSLYLGVVGTPH